jgi:perosamine synthetase
MSEMKIPLFKPEFGQEELDVLKEVFDSHWVGVGPRTAEFEKQFASFVSAPYAVAVNSGTAALHIAVAALGIGPGDEVIVPAITVVSTPNAALYTGATPVIVDVDSETHCMDPASFEKAITSKTKAVIPVHLGGHPADLDPIIEIAKKHNIVVIEDCAEALGAKYKGKQVGTVAGIGCYSFEAKKNISTGDGGMVTFDDEALAKSAVSFRWYGADRDTWQRFAGDTNYNWFYDVQKLGFKYNMTDIIAAIASVQLERLPGFLEAKRKIVEKYNQELKDVSWLTLPIEKEYAEAGWWLYVVELEKRDEFIDYLGKKGVTTSVHFAPLTWLSVYKDYPADVPNSEKAGKRMVSLPLYPSMTDGEFEYVIEKIKEFKA